MLSKLVVNVSRALETKMRIKKVICSTDSQVSLAWIKAVKKEFKTFVQNRVLAIRKNVDLNKWFYCRSEENAADATTRSITKEVSTWLSGPDILRNSPVSDVTEVTTRIYRNYGNIQIKVMF